MKCLIYFNILNFLYKIPMSTTIIYTLSTDKGKCQRIAANLDGIKTSLAGNWRHLITKVVKPKFICERETSCKRYGFDVEALFKQVGESKRFIWVGHGSEGRLRSTDGKHTNGNINLDKVAKLIALTKASKIHINACYFGVKYIREGNDTNWAQTYGLKFLGERIAYYRDNATFLLTGNAESAMLNVGSDTEDMIFNSKFGHPYYKYKDGILVESREETTKNI